MSKLRDFIDDDLAAWIRKQHVFFVATAPESKDGHLNCSPKGGDCFRILGPSEVAYQDYTGSGVETMAHLRENGRIILMFCAFDGKPEIARLHGQGEVVVPGDAAYSEIAGHFPPNLGTRAYIRVSVTRISTSCGFAVPLLDFRENRETLDKWAVSKGEQGLKEYRAEKNVRSIDGLPAFGSN